MKHRFVRSFVSLVAFIAMTPALAVTEAYLSPTGSGSACTLAAPCSNIVNAITAAGVGGEVICLAKGAYASNITFSITNSITISCGEGLLEAPHGQIDIVGTPASSNVVIEGLVLDAETSGCCNLTYNGQGTLDLRHVRAGNITGANSHGLRFTPNGDATLIVSDSIFYDNGGNGILVAPTAGKTNVFINNSMVTKNGVYGVLIQPSATGSANVVIDGLRAVGNVVGVHALAAASANSVRMEIRNSTLSENSSTGLSSRSANNGVSSVLVESSSVSNNASTGLFSRGANSRMLVGKSTITGNQTGMFFSEGGALLSYGNNNVANITAAGGPSGSIGLQ